MMSSSPSPTFPSGPLPLRPRKPRVLDPPCVNHHRLITAVDELREPEGHPALARKHPVRFGQQRGGVEPPHMKYEPGTVFLHNPVGGVQLGECLLSSMEDDGSPQPGAGHIIRSRLRGRLLLATAAVAFLVLVTGQRTARRAADMAAAPQPT